MSLTVLGYVECDDCTDRAAAEFQLVVDPWQKVQIQPVGGNGRISPKGWAEYWDRSRPLQPSFVCPKCLDKGV